MQSKQILHILYLGLIVLITTSNGYCKYGTMDAIPKAINDTVYLNQDDFISIYPLSNDSSSNGIDISSIKINAFPKSGSIVVYEDGKIDYQQISTNDNKDSFTYSFVDFQGRESNIAEVFINFNNQNKPPISLEDTYCLDFGDSIILNILSNDIDENVLQTDKIEIVSNPLYGTLKLNSNGELTYKHEGTFINDFFRYIIRDVEGKASEITPVFLFIDREQCIHAKNDTFTVLRGSNREIPILRNDTFSDSVNIIITKPPQHGEVSLIKENKVVYRSFDSEYIEDCFFYKIASNGLSSSEASVSIIFSDVNKSPIAVNDSFKISSDRIDFLDILSNDFDNENEIDTSSIKIEAFPRYGSVSVNINGTISYQVSSSSFDYDTIIYSVADLEGLRSNIASVFIKNAIENNSSPYALNDSYIVSNGNEEKLDILSNDFDFDDNIDVNSIEIVKEPIQGTITSMVEGAIFYSRTSDLLDSLEYRVNDEIGNQSQIAKIFVYPDSFENDFFFKTLADTFIVFPNQYNLIDIIKNDEILNKEKLDSIVISSYPVYGDLRLDKFSLEYKYDNKETELDWFVYHLKDKEGRVSGESLVIIDINFENISPISSDDYFTMNEGEFKVLDILSNDYDEDDKIDFRSLEILQFPKNGSALIDDLGKLQYVHDGFENYNDTLTYRFKDLGGLYSDTGFIYINIIPVNDRPLALDDVFSIDIGERTHLDIVQNDVDPEGRLDSTNIIIDLAPIKGNISFENNKVNYFYDGAFIESDSFSYKIVDIEGLVSEPAMVKLLFNSSTPPIAFPDSFFVVKGETTEIDLLINDINFVEGFDIESLKIIKKPKSGEIKISESGKYVYINSDVESREDFFTYIISDIQGNNSNEVSVRLRIISDDDIFTQNDSVSLLLGGSIDVEILSNDIINSNRIENLIIELVREPIYGTVSIQNNILSYSSNKESKIDSLIYRVKNVVGKVSNPSTVYFNITDGIGTPPIAINDTIYGNPNENISFNLINNDIDVDGNINKNSLIIVQPPKNGIVTNTGNGNIIYELSKASEDFTDVFTYTITDDNNLVSNEAIVTILLDSLPNSLDNEEDLYNFSVYPNPFDEYIIVEMDKKNDISEIEVFDINGKLIFKKSVEKYQETIRFGLSEITSGIYIVKIKQGDFFIHKKLFKI